MSFTESHLYFDDVEVGQEWRSLGRTITETDIVNFAGLSGDFNPIHIDHQFASTTPFRRPIAHGLLVFSIASGLGLFTPPMRTMAILSLRDWQFKGAVFPGDTIHVVSKVLEKKIRGRGRRGEITWQRLIYNQDKKIVQEGISVTLVEGRETVRTGASQEGVRPQDGRADGEGKGNGESGPEAGGVSS